MKKNLIQLMLLFGCVQIQAQQTVVNSGNWQIHTGASVGLFGNFTNGPSATLVNNGSLYVKQNITSSQASMNTGAGTLYMNGSVPQTISGSQPFKTYNLVTNNTAGIMLNTDLSITGAHTFLAGMINTSTTPNYLAYEAGSSYTGDGDSRHVNGWVKKTGSTSFIFPVGSATIERTVSITGLSASSVFVAKYSATTPNTFQLQAPLISIDPNEYWILNKVSGGSALVAMNWDHARVSFVNWTLPEISVANYDGSNWVNNGGTGSGNVTATGTITSNSITSFNQYTFASKSYPVPLTLISFTAKRFDGFTQLNWQTVNEQKVSRFTVERSDDGLHFIMCTELPARNTGDKEVYLAKDIMPVDHIAYYRLRSTDQDGRTQLSAIVSVTGEHTSSGLTLVTNPVSESLVLLPASLANGNFTYSIYISDGHLLQQGQMSLHSGARYTLRLTESIRKGAYTLLVTDGIRKFSIKFIVQ